MKWLVIAMLLCATAKGADRYAFYSTVAGGSGTLGDPWPLWVALTNTAGLTNGDTLWVRGGTNKYGGLLSLVSGVTVRSYPGEWAVITDGLFGTLMTNLPATTNTVSDVKIANSESWPSTITFSIGTERLYPLSKNGTNYSLLRGYAGTTVASHSSNDVVVPFQSSIIEHSGTNCVFRDFELTSLMTTNRISSDSFAIGAGLNLNGRGNKALNLVIHDTGHPPIGFWDQGEGGEINGCLIWGCGVYDYVSPFNGTLRGSGIYGQNADGTNKVINSVFNRQFTAGAKFYGTSALIRNTWFQTNVSLNNGLYSLEVGADHTTNFTSGTRLEGNRVTGRPLISYTSLANRDQRVTDNIFVNGSFAVLETTNSVYTNNAVFLQLPAAGSVMSYSTVNHASNALGIVWNDNDYYLPTNTDSMKRSWGFRTSAGLATNAAGGGTLYFQGDSGKGFTNWSGFDVGSTYAESWPTNYLNVTVTRRDYDPTKWHICVISTSGQTSAPVTLSDYGFPTGHAYRLIDAQNWPVVAQSAHYAGGVIDVPLNLTNYAALKGTITNTVAGNGLVAANAGHYNEQYPGLFNAFILEDVGRGIRLHVTGRAQ